MDGTREEDPSNSTWKLLFSKQIDIEGSGIL